MIEDFVWWILNRTHRLMTLYERGASPIEVVEDNKRGGRDNPPENKIVLLTPSHNNLLGGALTEVSKGHSKPGTQPILQGLPIRSAGASGCPPHPSSRGHAGVGVLGRR